MSAQSIYGLIILVAFVGFCLYVANHCINVHTTYNKK